MIAAAAVMGGCGGSSGGGSGGSGNGTGTGNAIQDALTDFDTVRTVISTGLNVATPGGTLPLHVHCSSGQAEVSGSTGAAADGTFAISANLAYASCDGTNGTVTAAGPYATAGTARTFTADLGGTAGGNGCSVDFTSTTYLFTVDTSAVAAPTAETAGGTLSATCTEPAGSATVSCDWGAGTVIANSASLTAGCSCTGSGCG